MATQEPSSEYFPSVEPTIDLWHARADRLVRRASPYLWAGAIGGFLLGLVFFTEPTMTSVVAPLLWSFASACAAAATSYLSPVRNFAAEVADVEARAERARSLHAKGQLQEEDFARLRSIYDRLRQEQERAARLRHAVLLCGRFGYALLVCAAMILFWALFVLLIMGSEWLTEAFLFGATCLALGIGGRGLRNVFLGQEQLLASRILADLDDREQTILLALRKRVGEAQSVADNPGPSFRRWHGGR